MSRLNHKKNHIPIDDDNFDLNFSTTKNILETYEKSSVKKVTKLKICRKLRHERQVRLVQKREET